MFAVTRRQMFYSNLTPQGAQFECFVTRDFSKDVNFESEKGNKEKKMPVVNDPQQAERRRKFWEQEKEFESMVDYSKLSETEKLIHTTHAEAISRGHFTYDDPENGDRVFTRLRHFLKGSCCGSACRHCIYDHIKVPEVKKKTRRFNTAYWTYDEDYDSGTSLPEGYNLVKPMVKKKQASTQTMTVTCTTNHNS